MSGQRSENSEGENAVAEDYRERVRRAVEGFAKRTHNRRRFQNGKRNHGDSFGGGRASQLP